MSKPPPAAHVRIKRIYQPPAKDDGVRILVDRIWPRGVAKATSVLDHWMKDLAPSTALRQWFGHDPVRWNEFRTRYRDELRERRDDLQALRDLAREQTITLIYSARDEQHNQAVVLRDAILQR